MVVTKIACEKHAALNTWTLSIRFLHAVIMKHNLVHSVMRHIANRWSMEVCGVLDRWQAVDGCFNLDL